jgi:hypothetical protein
MKMVRSFKEHSGIFAAVDCSDWGDFKAISYQMLRHFVGGGRVFEHFIFRGQSCSSWPLMSSFDRRHFTASFKEIDERYKKALNAFIKNYEIYGDMDRSVSDNPFRGDRIGDGEYEAFAQHFGMPTRLLDWTKSLYVAAFFAFSKVEECSTDIVSIWALNSISAKQAFSERHVVFLDDIYKENKRQLWQMGVFVSNRTDRRNFADLFSADSTLYPDDLRSMEPILIRFDLPKSSMSEAIDDLNMMRINSMTLFPGIEGVVRWIDRGGYALD